jgi:hypothetical protein
VKAIKEYSGALAAASLRELLPPRVLWVLKLISGTVPQLDTVRFLDRVAEATSKATGLPDSLVIVWVWHWVIGTALWATLSGIMFPILRRRKLWNKGIAVGVISGLPTMLRVMPLAGAGYLGMDLNTMGPCRFSRLSHYQWRLACRGVRVSSKRGM